MAWASDSEVSKDKAISPGAFAVTGSSTTFAHGSLPSPPSTILTLQGGEAPTMGRHLALGLQLKAFGLRRRRERSVCTYQRGRPEQEPLDLSSEASEGRHRTTGERFKDSDFSPLRRN